MEKRFLVGVKDKVTLTLRESNRVVVKLWVLSQDKLSSNFFQAARPSART